MVPAAASSVPRNVPIAGSLHIPKTGVAARDRIRQVFGEIFNDAVTKLEIDADNNDEESKDGDSEGNSKR